MSFTERLADSLQLSLQSGQLWLALAAAFVGGLLTSFTPCVYPLIPITIRYFGGMKRASRGHVVVRASVYVAGMILLYAALGTAFASMKLVFGSFLSSPWVLAAIAAFCVAMGVSMLGAFSLQLPSGLNTRLSRVGGQGVGGAFLMGLVSGLIAAPCTGPVLAVILTLIAASGAMSLGFGLMVAFGLGLGLPFLALAVFSGALTRVPTGGTWMEVVKIALATAMFVVALYFLAIAWPGAAEALSLPAYVAVALAIAGTALAAGYLRRVEARGAAALKIGGVVLLTAAVGMAVVGGEAGRGATPAAATVASSGGSVPDITWATQHDAAVALARSEGRPVMIDFGAEWCQACKELEKITYVDPRVRAAAQRFVNVKLDATEIDDDMQKLFDRYGVVGLPTVVFIDSKGVVLKTPRVTGFVPADRFAELLARVH